MGPSQAGGRTAAGIADDPSGGRRRIEFTTAVDALHRHHHRMAVLVEMIGGGPLTTEGDDTGEGPSRSTAARFGRASPLGEPSARATDGCARHGADAGQFWCEETNASTSSSQSRS
jgi:hypothetical protein